MNLRLEVCSIKNISMDLELVRSSKPIEVLEFSDQELVVNLSSSLQAGVLVSLVLRLVMNTKSTDCIATGKVLSSYKISDSSHKVKFHLAQVDSKVWETFVKACNSKQSNADKIFDAIKGDKD